jgi:hypothetical protein
VYVLLFNFFYLLGGVAVIVFAAFLALRCRCVFAGFALFADFDNFALAETGLGFVPVEANAEPAMLKANTNAVIIPNFFILISPVKFILVKLRILSQLTFLLNTICVPDIQKELNV